MLSAHVCVLISLWLSATRIQELCKSLLENANCPLWPGKEVVRRLHRQKLYVLSPEYVNFNLSC